MSDYRSDSTFEADLGALGQSTGHPIDDAVMKASLLADKARASVDKVLGKAEYVVERTLGGPTASKVRAKADKVVDRAEDIYAVTLSRVDDELTLRPYRTLALVAGAGVLLGLLLAKRERTIIYRAA